MVVEVEPTVNISYGPPRNLDGLERRILGRSPLESATAMAERAREIDQRYRAVDNDYNGVIGTLRKIADYLGITSFQRRLQVRVRKGKKTVRGLESIADKSEKESSKALRELSGMELRQAQAEILIDTYEGIIRDLDEQITGKTEEYKESVKVFGLNSNFADHESLTQAIYQLKEDRAKLKNKRSRAAVEIIKAQERHGALYKQRSLMERQKQRAITAALRGDVRVSGLEPYTRRDISPYKFAKTVQQEELQSVEIDELSGILGDLHDETLELYSGLDIDNLDGLECDERTQGLMEAVEEEDDMLVATAKRIMEDRRGSS